MTTTAGEEHESPPIRKARVVTLDWEELVLAASVPHGWGDDAKNGDGAAGISSSSSADAVLEALERAYGASGTGILAIRNMPGFVEAKGAFLPLAHALATRLPEHCLERHLTDATSLYNAGWSHGKERLGGDHRPADTSKGSYYYNPVSDAPGTEEDRRRFPLAYPRNVWPEESLLPTFRHRAIALGLLLKDACVVVSKHMDRLARKHEPDYPPDFLYDQLKGTDKVKARLLYYFPLASQGSVEKDGDGTRKMDSTVEDSWVCKVQKLGCAAIPLVRVESSVVLFGTFAHIPSICLIFLSCFPIESTFLLPCRLDGTMTAAT
jgi:hypothetical protein